MAQIDLKWADEQYLTTLLRIIGEIPKVGKKPERKKVNASMMSKFVKGE